MSKKKPSQPKRAGWLSRRGRHIVIASAVVLGLFASWTLAHSGALDPLFKQKKKTSGTVSIQSFNSSSPSKEYIYAGGRLVATEEPSCSFSLSSTSQSFAASTPSGAINTGSVNVSAPPGCAWSATVSSGSTFITITSGSAGTGNGAVNYSVQKNFSTSARSGTINIAGLTYTVLQGAAFTDVPTSHPYYIEIGKISARGVTAGCGGGMYCPDGSVDRAQMSVFLLRGLGAPTPPVATVQSFCDVPPGPSPPRHWAYDFIEEFYRRGLTAGCATSCPSYPPPQNTLRMYCPESIVTHAQMAVFTLRALAVDPPAPASQRFYDVPPSHFAYRFVEEFYIRGIWSGCATGTCNPPPGMLCYCPESNVTRAQMALLMVRAFNL